MDNLSCNLHIETERLWLRPIQTQDREALYKLDTDPDVRHYFPEGILTPSYIDSELVRYQNEWATLNFGMFGIFDKHSQTFIGRGGFAKIPSGEVEFGYLLIKAYWGRGLATEAAQALLQWGLQQIPTDRIIGFARIDHVASRRVLEKCGMIYFKRDVYHEQEWDFFEKRNNASPG